MTQVTHIVSCHAWSHYLCYLFDILDNITGNKVHDKQVQMQFVSFMNYKTFTLVGGNVIWWIADLLHDKYKNKNFESYLESPFVKKV